MVIRITKRAVSVESRSVTEATTETENPKEALRLLKDFLSRHNTGFDDFDEFHCLVFDRGANKEESRGGHGR